MLLQAVLVAAVPVIAGAIIGGVQAGAKYLASKAESDTARKYLTAAEEAARKAVTYTSQTYVDALKKSDKFTKENQEEALNRAVEKATNLLTHEAILFLEDAYGDLTELLKTYIEAEVRNQKREEPVLISELPEARESIDTTTLAAATAAASAAAAAVVKQTIPEAVSYVPNITVTKAPAE